MEMAENHQNNANAPIAQSKITTPVAMGEAPAGPLRSCGPAEALRPSCPKRQAKRGVAFPVLTTAGGLRPCLSGL